MTKPILCAALLVLLLSSAFSQTRPAATPAGPQKQPKPSPLLPYAGNWVGTFDNKPWFLLNLNLIGEQVSGSLQRVKSFDWNDNGELKKVSEDFVTETVSESALNPDGLLLTLKDPEAQDTDRYLMKLTSDTTAEVRAVGMKMPPGMSKPKPWKLTKAAASPAAKK